MEEGVRPIRKGCVVALVAMIAGLIGMMMLFHHALMETTMGKEYPPVETEPSLRAAFDRDFRWAGLPHGSLEKAWLSGFQDSFNLYRIRLSAGDFASLRKAVLSSSADGLRLNDADDLSSCPFGVATGRPQLPEKMKIPAWWEVSQLRSFDSLSWEASYLGHWLCYDAERGILFLFSHG